MKLKFRYLVLVLLALFVGTNIVNARAMATEDIENNTYIIGTHMFTRNTNDDYNGELTIQLIMLAARTIEGNSLDDMVIYYKNARGRWINGVTGDAVEMGSIVNIKYVDTLPAPTTSHDAPTITLSERNVDINSFTFNTDHYVETTDFGSELNINGIEFYEKNGNEYTQLWVVTDNDNIFDPITIKLDANEEHIIVARVYVQDGENRVFSNYSNEVISEKYDLAAPEIEIVSQEGNAYVVSFNVDDYVVTDGYGSNLAIQGIDFFDYHENELIGNWNYDLFDTYSINASGLSSRRLVVARAYIFDSFNRKVYSDNSNGINIDYTIPVTFNSPVFDEDTDSWLIEFSFPCDPELDTEYYLYSQKADILEPFHRDLGYFDGTLNGSSSSLAYMNCHNTQRLTIKDGEWARFIVAGGKQGTSFGNTISIGESRLAVSEDFTINTKWFSKPVWSFNSPYRSGVNTYNNKLYIAGTLDNNDQYFEVYASNTEDGEYSFVMDSNAVMEDEYQSGDNSMHDFYTDQGTNRTYIRLEKEQVTSNTMYFKIRSYHEVLGQKLYSAYSDVFSKDMTTYIAQFS